MLIIPAIDLRNGKCVRLVEGRLDRETIYSDDPAEMARKWAAKGARFLHLVDLDGAFAGEPKNVEAVRKIIAAVDIPAELGGGIRNMDTIDMYLDMGLNRVILGTAAISDSRLVEKACARYGERIVLGIDARDGYVAVEGWDQTAAKKAVDLGREMKDLGVTRIIYTDIKRDGTLKGPNLESTREMAEATGLKVIASGGVSSLEDLIAVSQLEPYGVEAVITGKALYDGRIDLEEALRTVNS
ncbi:1-(5-phosphoribosyl)-5-[(5-phosphoribosylamino)methylideneamino]imidazole-4-carboxamide isomerase [Thermincola potens]|uniref:1-(5-phosphoribosyl)-5-[(5-phosphoribosylamino)methylideneamino] imidazole-4-carboxamide isomerase n=1 Tax=Thermincola potens (strain JR) TaxID=635013 RepID=D5XD59_THEPJ|nr:1-(5-phosphoribosyl)-5-[(5-phosphoribosylamino)methylideneamino]imidazole-4-carboxamide isomerase [Thermincola potens]ADG81707.1 phosphoribosylformimino-5-aminoimidazole carboxamide ribotide isomerase [Thermincola potens JR]